MLTLTSTLVQHHSRSGPTRWRPRSRPGATGRAVVEDPGVDRETSRSRAPPTTDAAVPADNQRGRHDRIRWAGQEMSPHVTLPSQSFEVTALVALRTGWE